MPLLPMEMMVGERVHVSRVKITVLGSGFDHATEVTDVEVFLSAIENNVPTSIEIHCSPNSKMTFSSCGDRL